MSDSAQDDASPGSTEATAGTAEDPGTGQVPEVSAAPEAGTGPEDGDMPDLDDVKKHFREALDRKNKANSKDSSATGGKATGKAQGAHGPASTRRSFRRKSG
jgi:Family of unknown function (DUF5302)